MKLVLCILITFVLVAPFINGEKNMPPDKEIKKKKLLELDSKLADVSAEKGILVAFLPFMTEKSAILPTMSHPVTGKAACQKWIKLLDKKTPGWLLKWKPYFVDVSAAGDLAYSLGKFVNPVNSPGENTPGHYCTVWKKQAGGAWMISLSQGLILFNAPNGEPLVNRVDRSKLDKLTREVVESELAFCQLALKSSISEAFLFYIDDNGIGVPAGVPVKKEGYAKAVAAAKKNPPRPRALLEWVPFYSFVSASGDMGHNFGPYVLTVPGKDGSSQKSYGNFNTIWKKQADGSWKFAVDAGHSSPPPEKKKK